MTIRDITIAKLQQLSEPLLQQVNNYIDSVIHKHPATTTNSQQRENLVAVWEKWFDEVEHLEVVVTEPVSDYQSLLLKKYQQQGFNQLTKYLDIPRFRRVKSRYIPWTD